MSIYVHEKNLEAFLNTDEIFEHLPSDYFEDDDHYAAGKRFVENLDDIWDETIFDVFQNCLETEDEGAKYLNKLAQRYLATHSAELAAVMDMTSSYLCGYTVHSLIRMAGKHRLETDPRAAWQMHKDIAGDEIWLVYDGEEDQEDDENWRDFEWKPS